MKVYRVVVLCLVFALILAAAVVAQAPPPLSVIKWDYPPRFKNVTINVVGDAGHNLKPYEFWKGDFEKAGITIKIIEVPFEGVYEKEKTEFVAGTGAFDVVTFYPAYIGDFAGNGYLEPLDNYLKKTPAAVWDPNPEDVLGPFWELYCKFGGKVYALPIDGDVLMLQYRKDLIENAQEKAAFKAKYGKELKAPETWQDWLDIGKFFTRKKGEKLAGQVLERDFYGSAEFAKRGFSFAWFLNRWAPFGDPYFDKDMKPQINSANAVKALQNMVDSLKNSPPDVLGYGYDELRDAFIKGSVAMVVQWTDVPKKGDDPSQSAIAGEDRRRPRPGLGDRRQGSPPLDDARRQGCGRDRGLQEQGSRLLGGQAHQLRPQPGGRFHPAGRPGPLPDHPFQEPPGLQDVPHRSQSPGLPQGCRGGHGGRLSGDLHPRRGPVRRLPGPAREQGPGGAGEGQAGSGCRGQGMGGHHRKARTRQAGRACGARRCRLIAPWV